MDTISSSEQGSQDLSRLSTRATKLSFDTRHLHFPKFKHEHAPILDVNEVSEEHMTRGQKIADSVASTVGSWRFIIIQSTILLFWLILNSIAWAYRWDPYPFILLNLALSFQAAYSAPFVMMSQNRQAEKDRLTAQNDYSTDCKGEEEIRHIMEHLDHQDELILQLLKHITDQREDLVARLSVLDPTMVDRLGKDLQQASNDLVKQQEAEE
jgi:uncharacterized membrane protein